MRELINWYSLTNSLYKFWCTEKGKVLDEWGFKKTIFHYYHTLCHGPIHYEFLEDSGVHVPFAPYGAICEFLELLGKSNDLTINPEKLDIVFFEDFIEEIM